MKAGTHSYDGACRPGACAMSMSSQKTFSVGIFEWVPKAHCKGYKRGPVKVRVYGLVSDPRSVDIKAREIVTALNAGTYTGPKRVRV